MQTTTAISGRLRAETAAIFVSVRPTIQSATSIYMTKPYKINDRLKVALSRNLQNKNGRAVGLPPSEYE